MDLGNARASQRSLISNDHKFKQFHEFEELKKAVGGFNQDSLIGKGGFSLVYKGALPDNTPIAVKWLDEDNTDSEQFKLEIQILGNTDHLNVVRMLGYYCDDDKNKRLIVLELMPNKSLAFHLHGGGVKTTTTQVVLEWSQRMSIALDSAKGIAYLHGLEKQVIHRDIKSSNILLSNDYKAKIADFGLSRLMSPKKSHISSISHGTIGYVASECTSPFKPKYTDKSDVFAFGILLLEVITGKRSVFEGDTYLSKWVVEELKVALQSTEDEKCDYSKLADPKLKGIYNEDEMGRMLYCAAAAVYKPKDERPSMKDIVEVLENTLPKEWIWEHKDDKSHLRDPYYLNIVEAYEM